MLKKIYCLLAIIMLLSSCYDKNEKETIKKYSTKIIGDDEYIENVIKDSSNKLK